MTTLFFWLAAAATIVAVGLVIRVWRKGRGARLITCPENQRPAGVRVDARKMLLKRELRLKECSRWPEKKDCGQECLRQIETAPDGCLVVSILARWYADKECVYCGKPLGEIDWHERKPALLAPQGTSVEWHEIAPEQLPDVLASHRPVCWNCHVVETFRREHPDLVVERSR